MTHTVKKGDTLWSISRLYNISVDEIVKLNGLKNPDLIRVGQVLKIREKKTENTALVKAIDDCLNAIEKLPEFKALEVLIYGQD